MQSFPVVNIQYYCVTTQGHNMNPQSVFLTYG